MTKNNSTNWARVQPKRYEGKIKQPSNDSVKFIVYNSPKPTTATIPLDKVESKKEEWTKQGIDFKQVSK